MKNNLFQTLQKEWLIRKIKRKISKMGQGLYKPGNSSKPGYLYNPIPFPEFSDIPYQREACYERFDLICQHIPKDSRYRKTMLDVGSHTGFHCFLFDRLGYQCTGLEIDLLSYEIAFDVAKLYALNMNFINSAATPELLGRLGHFDITLFLSVFQWITQKEGFERAKDVLRQAMLSSDILFFETSMGSEGRAKMPMLPDVDSVEQMLVDLGVHQEVVCLGEILAPNAWLEKKRYLFRTRAI